MKVKCYLPFLCFLLLLAPALCWAQGGTLRNASNAAIGKIDNDGTVRNASNASIGKIQNDGTVRNASNAAIGKIDNDGTVRNSSNASIGKAQGVKMEWAAAYFFFDFF